MSPRVIAKPSLFIRPKSPWTCRERCNHGVFWSPAILIAFLMVVVLAGDSLAQVFPDFGYPPPQGWTGERFQLSQDYPQSLPNDEALPWESIDFRTEPKEYLEAILNYCFKGNLDVDFEGQNNTIRKWYHAPWLHYGERGREFVNGLTRERDSRPFELAADQASQYRNYAVGLYNARGGHVIGQVWKISTNPDYSSVRFPKGTVTFKLLFTTATDEAVPYLTGSPEWLADVDRSSDPQVIAQSRVRLLQIDVAVRDDRSSIAGWVFGTFHYDSSLPGNDPWKKLRPLALGWGNDPTLKLSDYLLGQRPDESWINADSPIVRYRRDSINEQTPKTMGLAGRANGPVDNPVSSCISCHSTAQIPATSAMIPGRSLSDVAKLRWFRNLTVGEPFDQGAKTLDFSLQLGVGIQNYLKFQESVDNLAGFFAVDSKESGMLMTASPRPSVQALGTRTQQFEFTREPKDDR